jgi:hypothetical protein
MKPLTTAMLLGTLALFIGCDRKARGPAYGQQQEFRRQIADSIPVKQWGYAIADVRVSEDAQKVLVVFSLPGGTNGINELVLTNDGFRKYRGSIFDSATRKAAEREHWAASAVQQSNRWARSRSRGPSEAPSFAPPEDDAPSLSSLFESGKASVIVTLPDQ